MIQQYNTEFELMSEQQPLHTFATFNIKGARVLTRHNSVPYLRMSSWGRRHSRAHNSFPRKWWQICMLQVVWQYVGCKQGQVGLDYNGTIIHIQRTAVPVPPTVIELCKKNVVFVIEILGPFFPFNTRRPNVNFCRCLGLYLAITQPAKYGRFEKTSLVRYNTGW